MSQSDSPFREVPLKSPMFDGPVFTVMDKYGRTQAGVLTREWILFLEQRDTLAVTPIIGFIINDGSTGTNVGPVLPAGRSGTVDTVTVAIKASDPSIPLTFDIWQNGVSIFDPALPLPTIAAAAAPTAKASECTQFTNLATSPLTVTENDIFTINISSGSSTWQFTVAIETAAPVENLP